MAPSRRKTVTTRPNNPTRRIMTRSIYKKQLQDNNLKSSDPSELEASKSDGVRSNNDACDHKNDGKSSNPSELEASKSDGTRSNNDACDHKNDDDGDKENKECNDVVCSTPKGKKYMIPKISACPPAPKKNRLVLSRSSSLTKATTSKFFSHPDLDVLFLFSSSRSNVNA